MWEWIIGALLGFLGELLRSLYADYTASQSNEEIGQLKEQKANLEKQLIISKQAQAIRDKVNAETDLNVLIDGL
ncbi:hypothetical protein SAMN04488056_101469 [Cohaesibacter marisflavi]|uniref:Uncharacterized protein n=1 Tax=Cohaesibacter marisflavi TaxID=655353 RepID=A0A1I5AFE5_9HYPH|nr:hypothetical protein [Cohaesibacter marisflavi]SFN61184.1 hypothetical protein SAMN04488056_101469 [Cohaesibacter marisflavi]